MTRFFEAIEGHDSCWVWTGMKMKKGYGSFYEGERQVTAHKYMYQKLFGEIPKDLVLDHICENKACVNPLHLRVTTHQVNILLGEGIPAKNAAKTSCKNGHPFSEENTRLTLYKGRVGRTCISCSRRHMRTYMRKKRARANSGQL